MYFAKGKPQTVLKETGESSKSGTRVTFWPDDTIFSCTVFDYDILLRRLRELAFLNKGLTITLKDERTGKEKEAARAMKTRELYVKVSLGAGKRSSRVWTSDLTYEYVKINSAYRT